MIPTIRNGIQMASNDISVISHNLANASANGFKRSRSEFFDSYGQGMNSMPGIDIGHGSRSNGPIRNFSQGSIKPSGSELDLAISGVGLFGTVMLEDSNVVPSPESQISYTRAGAFRLKEDGLIETPNGQALLGLDGNALRIPLSIIGSNGEPQLLTSLNVADDGTIETSYADGSVSVAGKIALYDFTNLAGLKATGNGYYVVSARSGQPLVGAAQQRNFGRILSGSLEAANVDVADEMVKLVKAQQAYSGSSRLLQTAVEMTRRLIGQ